MIEFEGYYSVSVEQVAYVSMRNGTGKTPYGLFLNLENGKELGVWYQTEISRKQAKERIVREIESEKRQDAERILNRLNLIEQAVKGLDKRQYKIWRQLGALLRVVPDEKNLDAGEVAPGDRRDLTACAGPMPGSAPGKK